MLRSLVEARSTRLQLQAWVGWAIVVLWVAMVTAWWQDGAHGFDEHSASSWREADYAAIARSFAEHDANPLHARVPWRGDTTGEVEMELPVAPWLAAMTGRLIGYHDSLIRRVSTVFAAAASGLFGWIALRRLKPVPALFAWGFFTTNPIVQTMATAMQPEAVMLFWIVCAVGAGLRWHSEGSNRWWWITVACVSVALLTKASTVYLLMFCGLLIWLREGPRGLLKPRSLVALGLALVAPTLWYMRARGIYEQTGLSLGLSNETHLLDAAVLADTLRLLVGNLIPEARYVAASIAGALLCLVGAVLDRKRQAPVLCLALSVACFYLAIGDTSSEGWAWYYHLHSVVPASLLAGAGFEVLVERAGRPNRAPLAAAAMVVLTAVLGAWSLLGTVQATRHLIDQRDHASPIYRKCVHELTRNLPPDARLVVRGGLGHDRHGHPIAYNEPLAFAWSRRLGVTFPSDAIGLDAFSKYADREPPWYWLKRADDPTAIADYARLEQFASKYPVVATCSLDPGYSLVRLGAR